MRRTIIRRLTVMAATALAMVAFASPAWAGTTYTVTKTADTNDGACNADCSLREAVSAANANGLSDTVNFAPGVGGAITLNPALGGISILDVGGTINGPGADVLAVSGGDAIRPFGIDSGVVATINGLTIKDGETNANGTGGGGVKNNGTLTLNDSTVSGNKASGGDGGDGGGIYNNGTLTLNDSTVSGNQAEYYGGGISNYGALTLNDSTVSGNTANGDGGGDGGGIANGGALTLNRSTVSGNEAEYYGGGILSFTDLAGKTTTIRNSTISDNTANSGGGVYNAKGLTRIESSTIADNTAPATSGSGVASIGDTLTRTEVLSTIVSANANNSDVESGVANSFLSNGHNLIGGGNAAGAFNKTGDRTAVANPGLETDADGKPLLADNGGPTWTHALELGSPAIDAGRSDLTADQRGEARPYDDPHTGNAGGDGDDIGSFERQNSAPVAGDDAYDAREDTTLDAAAPGVLDNDADADEDTLTAAEASDPPNGALTLDPDGSFTYTPDDGFSGDDTFTYEATDGEAGSNVATVTVTVEARDDEAPQTTIASGPPPLTRSKSASFQFTSSETNSTFECERDGEGFSPCSSPKGYGSLGDGDHTFMVRATDAAGNTDPTPAARNWTVDSVKPVITTPRPAPGSATRSRNVVIRARVTDSPANLAKGGIKLFVDGRARAFTSYNRATGSLGYTARNLSLGRHTVRITATDAAGNATIRVWSFRVIRR